MRQQLSEIQDRLDSAHRRTHRIRAGDLRINGYVSRVVAIRESAYEVAANFMRRSRER